jgi:uncharacterized protein YndB with AHSA1/START domain
MAPEASVGKLADDELLITRVFNAPVALVFRIWEQKEHMVRWWGPKDFSCTMPEHDFRPGGAWRAIIESPAYGVNRMGGQFREIERERRIVFTFAWEDEDGRPGPETLVTVMFEEQGGKTVQHFHQAPFQDIEARDRHIGGWDSCFDREQIYVETQAVQTQAKGSQP